jgi:RND family efflux transporter MFP subunit
VPRNTRLLRIDARDYRLALEQQAAQVDRARTELELEHGRKRIAEREWSLMSRSGAAGGTAQPPAAAEGGGAGSAAQPPAAAESGGNLALREPQLRSAQAALKAAESGLEQARLAVGKTGLVVPFNALVQNRTVDIGQLIAPGAPIATLVGTDSFWVQVSIPVGRVSRIDVPGLRGARQGSTARIRQRTGEGVVERNARVVRLLGDLDPAGRMARLLIEIDDPLALRGEPEAGAPLLLGAYVEVVIEGHEMENVVELPREALRDDDTVFLVGKGDKLVVRQVEVVWRQRDHVMVGKGLAAGDRVIVSPLAAPVAGMNIQVAEQPAAAAPGGGGAAGPGPGAPVGER